MALSKKTVQRLRRVARAIQRSPETYNQSGTGLPTCGSPGCIFGWAVWLFGTARDKEVLKECPNATVCYDLGASILGLKSLAPIDRSTGTERTEACLLYFGNNWPDKFREPMFNAPRLKPAKVAENCAKRIEHFIQTEGRE